MNYDFDVLEWNIFKEEIASTFQSRFAYNSFVNIDLLNNIEAITIRQNELQDAIFFAKQESLIDKDEEFYNIFDSLSKDDIFNTTNEKRSYDPLDFIIIRNFLLNLIKIADFIEKKRNCTLLKYIETFRSYEATISLITTSIDDKGVIKDSATNTLQDIRYKIREYKNKIQKLLSNIFNSRNADKFVQDRVIVLRNGRYVIPCKTNFNQYISGIIQDKSISGETLYIEPTTCVNENNNMQELIIAESEEIAKIIYSLIMALKEIMEPLSKTVKDYSYLSMLLETANYYKNTQYTFGELANSVKLTSIHHPLLYMRKRSQSISLDFEISKLGAQVIITGPNTGGKTVALKSVGLNLLIAYSGLACFGDSFKFIIFDNILADIGDKQSLIMDLSTFSSHILNIKRIIDIVRDSSKSSLVLFDELGTGTEPREGACLAVSIMQYLKNVGASAIITTHFIEVKNYAMNNSSIASFYAVDFDYDSYAPRYKLLKGVMGKSSPLIIAKRLGLDSSVLDMAERELGKYKSSNEVKVEELNQLIAENEHNKKLLEDKENEIAAREQVLNDRLDDFQGKLNAKESDLLKEAYGLLQRSKRLATDKLAIKNTSIADIEAELENTSKKIRSIKEKQKPVEATIGDTIYLEKYKKRAKILEIKADKVLINLEGLRMKIDKQDLIGTKVTNNIQVKKPNISNQTNKSDARRELLLVGKRVEEALDILEKFIDDSLLAGYSKVYVIHGRGSGELRKAVGEYARTHSKVAKHYLADNSEGGNAITVIEL